MNLTSDINYNLDKDLDFFNNSLIVKMQYKKIVSFIVQKLLNNVSIKDPESLNLLNAYKIIHNLLYNKNTHSDKNSIVIKKQDYENEDRKLNLSYIYIVDSISVSQKIV